MTKQLAIFITCLAGSFLLISLSAIAEDRMSTPSATLKSLFEATQTNSDWEALGEYIDWASVLQGMPVKQRERYCLSTPDNTREFYMAFLKDPSHAVRMFFRTKDLMATSNDQTTIARLKAALAEVNEKPLHKISQIRQQLRAARFDIGSESVKGDYAKVDIVVYSNDAMYDKQVSMIRTNGQWRVVIPALSGLIGKILGYIDSRYPDVYRECKALERAHIEREKEARKAAKEGIKAELSFVVMDEKGKSISGARVIWDRIKNSEGDDHPDGLTDKDGHFKAVSSRWSNKFIVWKVSHNGYEDKRGLLGLEAGETYWTPRDKSIHVVLKMNVNNP